MSRRPLSSGQAKSFLLSVVRKVHRVTPESKGLGVFRVLRDSGDPRATRAILEIEERSAHRGLKVHKD